MISEYIKQFEEFGFLEGMNDEMKLKVGTQMAKCAIFIENLQPSATLSEDDINLFATLSFPVIRRVVTSGYYESIDFNELKDLLISNMKKLKNNSKTFNNMDLEAEVCVVTSEEFLSTVNNKPSMSGKPLIK